MSNPDNSLDEFDNLPEDQQPGWAKALRKQQKEAVKRAEEAEARAAKLERGKVFDDLGIPPEKTGKLFRDSYSGDLDPEAVRKAAEEYGVIDPPPPPEPSVPGEDLDAHQRASEATAVSEPPPDLQDKLDAAGSFEEAKAILASAGALRDPSA